MPGHWTGRGRSGKLQYSRRTLAAEAKLHERVRSVALHEPRLSRGGLLLSQARYLDRGMPDDIYDVAIIGGGPAGVSGAPVWKSRGRCSRVRAMVAR